MTRVLLPEAVRVGTAPSAERETRTSAVALRDSFSVGVALVPLGLAFGMVLTQAGLDWWWATVFTALIYAGSFEFLLIGLVTALTPLGTVALTAMLVNLRHVFYALSFPLDRVRGVRAKLYSTFAMTDEAYALTATSASRSWSGPRIVWMQLYLHLYWIIGGTAGALLGALIGDSVAGLDFALPALFTVMAIDAARERPEDVSGPLLAFAAAVVAAVVAPGQMLPTAFALLTVALLVSLVASRLRSRRA
ncbi:AzlC family ABC transporter permease [Streptomyces spiramenti]|uniref:Branched-chain amino acid ABC transporter permease n=1 Tax=Streptomyces spiramenti TaxID=2720606 RepID=A0ABX1AQ46_9ACTN|nr:AzlC family ABC transporter permease [Streptomyces spiramenti]NJP67939.1 branched-chain amino acid ABC transporter permease [Streptomyces spiramenti]